MVTVDLYIYIHILPYFYGWQEESFIKKMKIFDFNSFEL